MYQLHGFIVINALIDNKLQAGKEVIAPLGELSPYSSSFSREVGKYVDPNSPGVRLMTFYSVEDGNKVPLSQQLANEVLQLASWLANESLLNRITADKDVLQQMLGVQYQGRIQLLEIGKLVTDGKYWLPQYLTFKLVSDTRENRYKIWFSDDAFQHQYDKFEIEVVPQIEVVDDYHKGQAFVRQILTENTVDILHQRTNRIANRTPYTSIVTYKYDWVNPDDKKDIIPTYWTVIIYGEAGQNSDVIRDLLADYVLKNSDYGRDQWENLIPDLFIPTEFYLSPLWTKFATENLQLQGGIHSPVVPYREIIPWAQKTMFGYEKAHLDKYVVTFGTIFKSIAIIACGHKKNRLAPINFEKAWPDYVNVYTNSRDFSRVSPEAQEFIMFLNELLVEAERMTPDTEIPFEMTRVKRGEMYYVTKNLNGVVYLMPLRYNFLKEIAKQTSSKITLPAVNTVGQTASQVDESTASVINYTPFIGTSELPAYHRGRPTSAIGAASDGSLTMQPAVGTTSSTEGTPATTGSTPAATNSGQP